MYKKKLWKPVFAGTLALTMALTPLGTTGVVSAAEPEEMTTEVKNAEDTTTEEVAYEGEEVTEGSTEEKTTEEVVDATEETSENMTDEVIEEESEIDTAVDIPLTEAYFPDEIFRTYISNNVDMDKNGVVSQAERDACTEIKMYWSKCKDLTGIQYFGCLEQLDCNCCCLTSLDVSKNAKLKVLLCGRNDLTSLDVSKNTKLEVLHCYGNEITSLNISQNAQLTNLDCSENSLMCLDVSKNTQLTELGCGRNSLASMNVSKNTQLTYLGCENNKLTSLDVSNNTRLERLFCDNNKLTSIDVSKNTQLTFLGCENNKLVSLDVRKNTLLESLNCCDNKLTSLDVSKNPKLSQLECVNNRLACLDLTNNTKIILLFTRDNEYLAFLNSKRQIDLTTIPGFKVSKMSNVSDGTLSGNILTFNSGVDKVTYTYDCGNGHSVAFAIKGVDAQTLTKAFCTRLYTLCLGRAADESGVNYWTGQLNSKKVTGASLGYNFVFSDEYKKKNTSDEAYVKMLYKVFMDREADKGGLNYWLDLLNQGMSREYVYKGFAESKEFTNICASYGIERGTIKLTQARDQNVNVTKFVNRIYVKAMNRKGDASGLNHWCNQILTKKMTPVQVAESFIYSKEFTDKNLSNTEYIKVLYRTFMGREADSAGLNYWLGRLNKGDSRKTVLKAFAGCQEFKNIVKSFGL